MPESIFGDVLVPDFRNFGAPEIKSVVDAVVDTIVDGTEIGGDPLVDDTVNRVKSIAGTIIDSILS